MLRRRLIAFLPVLPLLGVAVWLVSFASSMIRADFASMAARYRLDTWMTGAQPWSVQEWVDARADLQAAIRITPQNPALQDYLGSLYAFRGYEARRNPVLRKAFYEEALPYQRQSLALRQHNAAAWLNYALSQHAVEGDQEAGLFAERKALEFGKNELFVRQKLQSLIFINWDTQPSDLRAWATNSYCVLSGVDKTNFLNSLKGASSGRKLDAAC